MNKPRKRGVGNISSLLGMRRGRRGRSRIRR
jgi:hypothetical protein